MLRKIVVKTFNSVGLFGRIRRPETKETFKQVASLLSSLGLSYCLNEALLGQIDFAPMATASQADMAKSVDLAIVVGGDGSLLRAAKAVVDHGVPLIGVNRGRFGFLADIAPDKVAEILPDMLAGHYQEESRFLLELELPGDQSKHHALNDIVLMSGDTAHMTEFEVYVDGVFMCSEHSDGMIVATPTGSTAYALSGGGPIIHPASNAMVLVPMFSHTLNSRPVVLSADSEVSFKVGSGIDAKPCVSCDGERVASLSAGETIIIRRKGQKVKLLHPQGYEYFNNLGKKLNWGRRLID